MPVVTHICGHESFIPANQIWKRDKVCNECYKQGIADGSIKSSPKAIVYNNGNGRYKIVVQKGFNLKSSLIEKGFEFSDEFRTWNKSLSNNEDYENHISWMRALNVEIIIKGGI